MDYIVHIGVNKTGTSSLQSAFSQAREALKTRGIIYPTTGIELSAHHGISRSLKGQKPEHGGLTAGWQDRLAAECAGMDLCVLSSEDFATVKDPTEMATICPPGKTRIVFYAREHVAHTVSWYQQAVHSRNITASLPEFIEQHLVSYSALFDRWAAIYGAENVIARQYDRAHLVAGDIVADFCHLMRPDLAELFVGQKYDSNPSLAGNLLFVKRLINSFITREESMRIAHEMGGLTSLEPRFKGKIAVSAETVARIGFLARQDRTDLAKRTGLHLPHKAGAIAGSAVPDLGSLSSDLQLLCETATSRNFICAEFLNKLRAFAPGTLETATGTAGKALVTDLARALFAVRAPAQGEVAPKAEAWQTTKHELGLEARKVIARLQKAGYRITKG